MTKNKNYFKEMIKEETLALAEEYNLREEFAMNIIANLISHEPKNDYRHVEYLAELFKKASGYDAIAINCELRFIRNKIMQEIQSK